MIRRLLQNMNKCIALVILRNALSMSLPGGRVNPNVTFIRSLYLSLGFFSRAASPAT